MIEIRDISRNFQTRDGEFQALTDVSFDVGDNEFFSILGPSGCGKTTLLKMVAGLIRPSAGTISIRGTPVTGPGEERAMVFQHFVLLPWADVLTNAGFGLELRGVRRKDAREKARPYLEQVGLSRFGAHYPHELSGGMQQRVGLARALAVSPDILLMDEPFGALDAQTRQIMQEDLTRLWDKEKKTVIFVTHSMDEATYLSDRVLIMDTHPGRVREILDIPLERPREPGIRSSSRFAELTAHMWSQLRGMIHDPDGEVAPE
ncbi:MAG TPA: ABC transporter ATP-binding protein [Acidimicrobiia bacterium]|nr:ABC transporter ATP-binding protein [Acidimicrobiia bacterium]